MDSAGGDPVILEEDREKVVVRHAVIGENAERDDDHGHFSSEDSRYIFRGDRCSTRRAIGIYRPFL